MTESIVAQGDGIYTIDTGFMRPGLVASHLLRAGDEAVLIDVGVARSAPVLLQALRNLALPLENIKAVIVTHVHLDHAGGAGVLLSHLPEARLIVHPRGARHMIDPARLNASATSVYGEQTMHTLFGELKPVPAERVVIAEDGFRYSFSQRELQFIDTPGHARHHLCVIDRTSRSLFTGDAFGLSYRCFDSNHGEHIVPTTTPTQFDPDAYHRTIDRILACAPRQLFLAHFGRLVDVERAATRLHREIDYYVDCAQKAGVLPGDRLQQLTQLLFARLVDSLREQRCTLGEAEIHDLMQMDMNLNAQGLLHWFDRRFDRPQRDSKKET